MQSTDNPFVIVSESGASDRALFIRRTYLHLAGAILAFVLLETILLHTPGIIGLVRLMTDGMGWLVTLGLFMGVSWLADNWARSNASQGMQYVGLGLYVVAETVIFLPLLVIATAHSRINSKPGLI